MMFIEGGVSAGPDSTVAIFNHTGAAMASGAASDSCAICHWRTGEPMAAQTRELCFRCHSEVADKESKEHRHSVVPNEKYPALTCEGCHKLHNGGARPALAKNEIDLCADCHEATREYKSHPVVGVQGVGENLKGADGKPLTCASHCHDVHGADYEHLCRLEPGKDLCVSCHKEFN